MSKVLYLLLLVTCGLGCGTADKYELNLKAQLPANKPDYQKTIVGSLSGHQPLSDGTRIIDRWTKEGRQYTRAYLKAVLENEGIETKFESYESANLNAAIDLLIDPFQGVNVYGILPATSNSNDYIILGGHYDSGKRGAPGADDNATGIALIMSVLREVKQLKMRDKNLVVVFFDQEEEELIGSRAFLEYIESLHWNIQSIHCFDMVGWDGDGDKAMEVFSPSIDLINLYREQADKYDTPLKVIEIDKNTYSASSTDFDVFVPSAFEVIGAGECFYHRDSSPYKDSKEDTYDKVNFPYLLNCSNIVGDVIKELIAK